MTSCKLSLHCLQVSSLPCSARRRITMAFTLTDRRRGYELKRKTSCSEKHMCGLGVGWMWGEASRAPHHMCTCPGELLVGFPN